MFSYEVFWHLSPLSSKKLSVPPLSSDRSVLSRQKYTKHDRRFSFEIQATLVRFLGQSLHVPDVTVPLPPTVNLKHFKSEWSHSQVSAVSKLKFVSRLALREKVLVPKSMFMLDSKMLINLGSLRVRQKLFLYCWSIGGAGAVGAVAVEIDTLNMRN